LHRSPSSVVGTSRNGWQHLVFGESQQSHRHSASSCMTSIACPPTESCPCFRTQRCGGQHTPLTSDLHRGDRTTHGAQPKPRLNPTPPHRSHTIICNHPPHATPPSSFRCQQLGRAVKTSTHDSHDAHERSDTHMNTMTQTETVTETANTPKTLQRYKVLRMWPADSGGGSRHCDLVERSARLYVLLQDMYHPGCYSIRAFVRSGVLLEYLPM
jgi:hypothetical protein